MKFLLQNLFFIFISLTFTVWASREEYFTDLCIPTGSSGITLTLIRTFHDSPSLFKFYPDFSGALDPRPLSREFMAFGLRVSSTPADPEDQSSNFWPHFFAF